MRAPALLLMTCLPLLGCVEAKDTVVWNPDGKGTVSHVFVLDLKKADEVIQLVSMLFGQSVPTGADAPDPVAPGWWRVTAKGVQGYKLGKVERAEADGKRTTTVEATFDGLEAAAKGGTFLLSQVLLEKAADGTWTFSLADRLGTLKERAGQGDPAQGTGTGMDYGAILDAFRAQLAGLSVQRKITFPAPVLDTNGEKDADGRTVTWGVDFAKLKDGKDLVLTVKFAAVEGDGLKPFSYQPDMKAMLTRLTTPPPPAEEPPAAPAPDSPPTTAPGK